MKKAAAFALLFFLFVPFLPRADAPPRQAEGQTLAASIILNLQALKLQITQLESESESWNERLRMLEQQLENSGRLASVLGMLADDQASLYRKSLNRWKLCLFGLIGLLTAYNILKIFLRLKFKKRIW